MTLDSALQQFDRVDANLVRLEKIWRELVELMPEGLLFVTGSGDDRYSQLLRGYETIASSLPLVDGMRPTTIPMEINSISQARLDAKELGEWEMELRTEEDISQPGREIADYRYRFNRARRDLVRQRLSTLSGEIESLLARLVADHPPDMAAVAGRDWDELVSAFAEVQRLAGAHVPPGGSWADLKRHLRFGQGHDLHDIATRDWPAVRSTIHDAMYSELEPLPTEVEDLSALIQATPPGPVTTSLLWTKLSPEDFERLIFNIAQAADDYVNVAWLMRTDASDHGRDVSADHVVLDTLGSSRRERVIIQARHRLKRSVAPRDVAALIADIALWGPPPVDMLVIATSGRFSASAVRWIEDHNNKGSRPRIEMWPESHLESLLARRAHLVAEFGLR